MKILEKEVVLKNGKLKYREDEFGHSYFSEQFGYLPSVTTILSEGMPVDNWLLEWFKRGDYEMLERKKEQALEHGSTVHNLIYKLNKAEEIDMSEQSQRARKEIASYGQWIREYRPDNMQPEQIIMSTDPEMYYAGTTDLVCTIGDRKVLVDFKTSKVIGIKDYLQVLAYAKAWKESKGENIDEVAILQLGTQHRKLNRRTPIFGKASNGEGWAFHLVDQEKYSFTDFERVYEMFRFMNGGEIPQPPTKIIYPDKVQIFTAKGDFIETELDDNTINKEK